MLARHRRLRPWRAVAYFLLAAGGFIIWLDPSRNIEPLPASIRWVWASFIVVGGLVSAVGSIRDKWLYEFVALPLLVVGFGGLVIVLCAGAGTGRWAFAAWLGSIVVQTLRRWAGLWRFVNALKRASTRREDPRA
jgi:hypothetical protein